MVAAKKFDIENPADKMIENLQVSEPDEDGFHISKLSERDLKTLTLLDLLQNPPTPNLELNEIAKRLILNYDSFVAPKSPERIHIEVPTKRNSS